MTDCLIIGFNDSNFADYAKMVKSMGPKTGAYRDLNLAFITLENEPLRSMDVLNRYFFEGREGPHKPFHNADFLWPVITYLGTYLHRRGFSFDYINLPHLERDALRDKLENGQILTIAITTTLYVSPHPIIELISFIRKYNKTARIIVGGPFIGNQPKLNDISALCGLFEYLGADIYVISQEGEAALVNIIANLKAGKTLATVNNIAFKRDGKYELTLTAPETNPLEDNMVDYELFRPGINEFVTLRTAKSCPFSCSFCGFPQRAGKYKYMSVELVEKELNAIRSLGEVTTLTFIDDTFNVPKERFRELMRMMIRNNYGFKWNSFYRSDHGDEQTIELMARAGCEGVFLGVESGSDTMLQKMNKTARRKNYLTAIPLLQAAGISAHANVIIGFPGETFATVEETTSLIRETKPDFFRAQLWYADPITPIWKEREQYGVSGSAFNWSHRTMDSEMACDLIDRMFMDTTESVWLPQNGFEQWSLFYLQRKGMRLSQIKDFLRCFNAAITEKLIHPGREEVSPELLAALRQTAQFDRNVETDTRPVEVFQQYRAAEEFVAQEFKGFKQPANGLAGEEREVIQNAAAEQQVAVSVVQEIAAEAAVEVEDVLLAAYSAVLWRFGPKEDAAILLTEAVSGCEHAAAVRLVFAANRQFAEFLREIHHSRTRALRHGPHVFYILSNPTLMALHETEPVKFRFALRMERFQQRQPAHWRTTQPSPSELGISPKILLRADFGKETLAIKLSSPANWQPEAAVQWIRTLLISEFQEALARGMHLGEMVAGQARDTVDSLVQTHAAEAFNF